MEELTPLISRNTLEDRELVAAAQRNEAYAFVKLTKKYRKTVYYMLLRMVKNADDAEDLTQDAFAKAFNSIGKFDAKYAFSTWLFRIATNNCIDFIRKKRVQTVSIDTPFNGDEDDGLLIDIKDPSPDPNGLMLKDQRKEYLQLALARVPFKYRQLLELRYFKEYSYDEIAQAIEIPLGTVKAQLFRAREMLTQELKGIKDDI